MIKSASDGIHLQVIRGKAKLEHTLSLLGYDKINTRVVERHHGTSRLHNQRKVRKTLAFSKSSRYHRWMVRDHRIPNQRSAPLADGMFCCPR